MESRSCLRIAVLITIGLLVISCIVGIVVAIVLYLGEDGDPAKFIPLSVPAYPQFEGTYELQTLGNDIEQQRMTIGSAEVLYFQAGAKNTLSGVVTQSVDLGYHVNKQANRNEQILGDILGGQVKYTWSSDSTAEGNLLEGRLILDVEKASFLQLVFRLDFRYTVDSSKVILLYKPVESGSNRLRLVAVQYEERWGKGNEPWLMGANAVWESAVPQVMAEYMEWGFWEREQRPYDLVVGALETVRNQLQVYSPEYKVVDEDSAKELVGRQSGMKMYVNGQFWGDIVLHYKNNLGQMPNTKIVGEGSLGMIEWKLADGRYYAMVVRTSILADQPTAFYVFCDNEAAANQIDRTNPFMLYAPMRQQEMPGVLFATYSTGFISNKTDTVSTGEGSGTVQLGKGGGIYYSVHGGATHDEVLLVSRLFSLMGTGGIKATGNYYAYKPWSGNGLAYYLAMLRLVTAPTDKTLDVFGYDVGVLDRLGFPEWESFLTLSTPPVDNSIPTSEPSRVGTGSE